MPNEFGFHPTHYNKTEQVSPQTVTVHQRRTYIQGLVRMVEALLKLFLALVVVAVFVASLAGGLLYLMDRVGLQITWRQMPITSWVTSAVSLSSSEPLIFETYKPESVADPVNQVDPSSAPMVKLSTPMTEWDGTLWPVSEMVYKGNCDTRFGTAAVTVTNFWDQGGRMGTDVLLEIQGGWTAIGKSLGPIMTWGKIEYHGFQNRQGVATRVDYQSWEWIPEGPTGGDKPSFEEINSLQLLLSKVVEEVGSVEHTHSISVWQGSQSVVLTDNPKHRSVQGLVGHEFHAR